MIIKKIMRDFKPSENDKDICAICNELFFHCNCGEHNTQPEAKAIEEPQIILNKRQLADLLNWINTLSNTVGLKGETYNDVIRAIDKANKRL